MSEFVSHTPEDLSKKPNLQDRVDKVADLVGNLMGTSNADEEAWIKRAGIFQQIQTEVGYGFRNAGDLLLVQDDDRKTEKQKELAKEAEELLVLGTAKALIGGSNEDKEAIGVGSIMKIKERLPEELNGLEKKVRDSIIDEPEIQKILDPLDIVRKRVAKAGEAGQKVLEDQINKTQEKLILLEVDSTKEDQLGMVVEWLGREGDRQKNDTKKGIHEVDDKTNDRVTKVQEKMLIEIEKANDMKEQDKIRREREAVIQEEMKEEALEQARYETFQAMLLHKNPITIDVFQQYAPEWMREEKDKPLMQTLVALANCCFYKWKYGDTNLDVMVDPRAEAVFNAPNEMMQKMYEIPGVRDTMESIVRMFFVEGREDGIDEVGNKLSLFVLKLKPSSDSKKDTVVEMAQNIGNIQVELVNSLIADGLKKSDAMLAVSTAYNLLYVGHVFEDADKTRRLKPCDAYVEQMRAFMFPATKARVKYGLDKIGLPASEKSTEQETKNVVGTEEGWGGQLGQWLTEVVVRAKRKLNGGVTEKDPDISFLRKYQRGEVHPFPERLFASFFALTDVTTWEYKVDDKGNNIVNKRTGNLEKIEKNMSLAQALYEKRNVDFEKAGKGVNPWGGYYDASDSANKLYKIVKGDQKSYSLPLGDLRAVQAVAGWAHEVSDARKKVRSQERLRIYVDNREFVKWIIAACVQGGIYQHSAELVLMTPDVETNQDVSFDGLLKRRDLLENDDDKRWLKKEFHAENFGSRFTRMRIIKRLGRK